MKHFVDIHVALATVEDMDYWDEQAEEAADKLNSMLHLLYDHADEDINSESLENMIQYIWENWRQDSHLLDIDEDDLHDWVDQLLATWDDELQEPR
jgi:predicted ArsR family transcriptional regulator